MPGARKSGKRDEQKGVREGRKRTYFPTFQIVKRRERLLSNGCVTLLTPEKVQSQSRDC